MKTILNDMESIEELENKYQGEQLRFDPMSLSIIELDYDAKISYILEGLEHYAYDVKNIIEYKLSYSLISNLSYNLVLQLGFFLDYIDNYKYVQDYYLYIDWYNNNEKYYNEFKDVYDEIIELLLKIKENGLYAQDSYNKDIAFDKEYEKRRFGYKKKPLFRIGKKLAYRNGNDLIPCLEHLLGITNKELCYIKNNDLYLSVEKLEKIFDLNYLYYVKNIWPTKKEQYRLHVTQGILRGNITEERLDNEYRALTKNFCTTSTGKIWEDFSGSKAAMALEMKRKTIDKEQWEFFFETLLKLEEINILISETTHPERDNDISYPDSMWDKIFNDVIDVKKVKGILPALMNNKIDIPNCFVVHRILEEIEWLDDEMDVHFIKWIKDVYGWNYSTEHFKSIKPEFKNTHSLDWNANTITSAKIALEYKALADKIRKEFVVMDGRSIKSDNTYYFKKPELYIEHKKKP